MAKHPKQKNPVPTGPGKDSSNLMKEAVKSLQEGHAKSITGKPVKRKK